MNFTEFKQKYEHKKVEEYPNNVSNSPVVSVCVQTYQHASYIKDCLDGILMQKTDFPFEILLGEDASTDGTREICMEYAQKYPEKIKLFLHHRENNIKINGNPSGRFNMLYNLYSARGEHIAFCEGDDYWTDPLKLQKQVGFLENNNDYSFSFHPVKVKNEIKESNYAYPSPSKQTLLFKDILKKHYIATCSIVFKSCYFQPSYPKFFFNCIMGDIPLELILVSKGKVYFFKEYMAIYRKNAGGITMSAEQKKKGRKGYLYVYRSILKLLFPKYFFILSLKWLKTYVGYIKDYIMTN